MLTADDLTADQQHHLAKPRRHNRFLHGRGVVCGAGVRAVAGKAWTVVVEPGYLLGPQGDVVLIDACVEVDLSVQGLDGNAACPCVDPIDPWCATVRVDRRVGQRLFIAAAYAEFPSRPVRVQPAGCGCDDAGCEYSRLRDGYGVLVLTSLPDSYAQRKPPVKPWLCPPGGVRACPDCVADPWMILAAITVRRSTVSDNDIDNVTSRRHVIGLADDYVLCGPKLLSIVLVPTGVVRGDSATATVTIDRPAPQGDFYIMLASTDPTSAIAPDSVIVPGCKTSAPVTVSTTPAGPGGPVVLSTTLMGDTKSATLQILTPKSVTLDQDYVQVGTSTAGTVALTAPAPAGGVSVTLAVDDATLATVPTIVTVPEGQATAPFTPITATGTGGLVLVTATLAGVAKTANLGTYSLTALAIAERKTVAGRQVQGTVTGGQQVDARLDAIGITAIQLRPALEDGSVTVQEGTDMTGIVPLREAVPPGPPAVADLLTTAGFLDELPPSVSVRHGESGADFKFRAVKPTAGLKPRGAPANELPITARLGAEGLTVSMTILARVN